MYDKNDPEKRDDVSLVLDALDDAESEAMEQGDSELVWHIIDLKKRIAKAAGGDYESEVGDGPMPAEANP